MTAVVKNVNITKETIKGFEKKLMKFPQVDIKVTHRFLDGMYAREVYMLKGTLLTSKTHKTENLSIISKGKVLEISENSQVRELSAPYTMVSPPGMKRALYIIEDTVWTTVHKNIENIDDLEKLESMIIEPELIEAGEEKQCLG